MANYVDARIESDEDISDDSDEYENEDNVEEQEQEQELHKEKQEKDPTEEPGVDIWVDKSYVILDRYTRNEDRIYAASTLAQFVAEQEENFEESIEALKETIAALYHLYSE
ncbi:uncharacterized protein DFL_006480 [Arthrobotrys flagrans]|uniref:Uncharacterized protein n=1 Tax=Arthrobotrys flagrans TaxID=97331 RepID=A0A437A0J8_ARTFL|nr:hypothetical protein DFL_006480 [Arthrobotrys flagrans]